MTVRQQKIKRLLEGWLQQSEDGRTYSSLTTNVMEITWRILGRTSSDELTMLEDSLKAQCGFSDDQLFDRLRTIESEQLEIWVLELDKRFGPE